MPDKLPPAVPSIAAHSPEAVPVEERPKLIRYAAIAAACVLLALPILYLMLHRKPVRSVLAGIPAAAPAQPSIETLEQQARVSPTVDNRIDLSLTLIHANQPGRAIPILNSIVAEYPNNALAWNNLCVAHTMQMAYRLAIDDCNRAIRIAPDLALARNNLSWAQDENRKALAAIATREQIAPAQRNAGSWLAEGLDDLHIGNYDKAIAAWKRTLGLDPTNAYAANNIGTAYMLKQQPALAIPWFEKAASLAPNLQLAENNLAWARGEQAKARKPGNPNR